jgi:hypothetical protein
LGGICGEVGENELIRNKIIKKTHQSKGQFGNIDCRNWELRWKGKIPPNGIFKVLVVVDIDTEFLVMIYFGFL